MLKRIRENLLKVNLTLLEIQMDTCIMQVKLSEDVEEIHEAIGRLQKIYKEYNKVLDKIYGR